MTTDKEYWENMIKRDKEYIKSYSHGVKERSKKIRQLNLILAKMKSEPELYADEIAVATNMLNKFTKDVENFKWYVNSGKKDLKEHKKYLQELK